MKNQGLIITILAVAGGAYFFYKKADATIESATNAVTGAFWSLFQGGGVEVSDFSISRLHRDFFDENWVMLKEPRDAYSISYPEEMSEILNANSQLKIEYRGLVT